MTKTLGRFVDAFFGRTDITPTRDEYGMYTAKAAALRSADLARQVGAAVLRPSGEVLTQGCNEVSKAGGGNYWDEDEIDFRDEKGFDSNDKLKRDVLRNCLERLRDGGFTSAKINQLGLSDTAIVQELTDKRSAHGVLSDAWIMDITEFGRSVHAEMNAICDAARTGTSIQGAVLYCTTFPCHNCTKHILRQNSPKTKQPRELLG